MWADPVADMLTRIRNALQMRKGAVAIPSSKLKVGIANVLKDEGYINGYEVIEDNKQNVLRVDLKYGKRGEDVVHKIQRYSKPGCRKYSGVEDLPEVLNGLGTVIVSTSQGVLSDRICREKRIGGEILCTIY